MLSVNDSKESDFCCQQECSTKSRKFYDFTSPAAFENLNIQNPTVNNSKEFDSMLSVNSMRPLCAVIDSADPS